MGLSPHGYAIAPFVEMTVLSALGSRGASAGNQHACAGLALDSALRPAACSPVLAPVLHWRGCCGFTVSRESDRASLRALFFLKTFYSRTSAFPHTF